MPSLSSPVNESLLIPSSIPSLIDHTLLRPDAAEGEIARLCQEARDFGFVSVCVNPCWVPLAAKALRDGYSRVCTVVGFPLGASQEKVKLAEARQALEEGAAELDMVLNIGALRSGFTARVRDEIAVLAETAHGEGAILKVILETCLLTRDEKLAACEAAAEAQADFVKTSTGFSTAGATIDDIQLMREAVGSSMGVKASGGVRTWAALQGMVRAGANRIGTSSGVSILREISQTSLAPSREDTY
ncbi:MAG TPA: deoxyribose-phosphate aldolase [Bryobacteraceae bacterium]|nr:deoxyribose-phosphate aldolase [Bryobacteraceae bacterium]